jgi:hypothetical protein
MQLGKVSWAHSIRFALCMKGLNESESDATDALSAADALSFTAADARTTADQSHPSN